MEVRAKQQLFQPKCLGLLKCQSMLKIKCLSLSIEMECLQSKINRLKHENTETSADQAMQQLSLESDQPPF